ncbi:MAG: hypothetical protein RIF41_02405 [Polyangiaceae bacterium]
MTSRHVLRLLVLALVAALSGCLADEPTVESQTADAQAIRRVLLCQQGLSDRSFEWDKGLFALCEAVEDEGFTLVWDGDYPAFGALDGGGAYEALFDTLDTNGDGLVDEDDTRSAIHLAGFSWGGMHLTKLARTLLKDDRIIPERRGVMAMVLFDPYQPFTSLTIPPNVLHAFVYRQSETTSADCAHDISLGIGFNASVPTDESELGWCAHYDLDAFLGDVGHCQVPSKATQAAFVNLTERDPYGPWDDHAKACAVD